MASGQSTKPSMIEFTDILLTTALPLHPSLSAHPRLSVALVEDENVYAETSAVDGDLAAGIWQINSSLSTNSVKQSVTLAVVASENGDKIRFASVTLSVAELITRMTAQPDGYQEFVIDSGSIQLLMTCMVEAAPLFVSDILCSQDLARGDDLADTYSRDQESDSESELSEPFSRDVLECFHAQSLQIPDEDMKASALCLLGIVCIANYQETMEKADLEKAISMHEEAMQFTSPIHPHRAVHAEGLAVALVERFKQYEDPVDVERAISQRQISLEATDDLSGDKPARLSNLGTALLLRFQHFGDLSDLESGILFNQEAVELSTDDHPHRPGLLSQLGSALQNRCESLGSTVGLEDAISNNRRAIELTQNGHPSKPGLLNNLGKALQFRFEHLGSVADLEDAISNMRKAVELTSNGHPNRATLFNNLGNALQLRFKRLGSVVDLDDAILNNRKAVELTTDGHPDEPTRLNDLGIALESRFERLGSLTDLEDAISNKRKAVELAPNDYPETATLFNNLGNALQSRFQRLGGITDLEEAISNKRNAVKMTPNGHLNEPSRLSNLGNALQPRFTRLGSVTDLEDAISNMRKAVELTPNGHPDKPGWLNNLGNALQIRFRRLGSITDLEDAISNGRKAVEQTPNGHPDNARWLNNLEAALQTRFKHLGSITGLEEAILNRQKAMELTPNGHPRWFSLFNNLGTALQMRFERLRNVADLEDAISNYRKALEITPDGQANRPGLLSNLGNALIFRFARLGSVTDLEDAVSNHRKALELAPDGHADGLGLLDNLGASLKLRYERLGSIADLEDAISSHQKVIELAPDGHAERAGWFKNLGLALLARFKRLNTLSDLESGLSALSTAANYRGGSAIVRFSAARIWAELAEEHSRSPLEAFSCAIDLLPRIAWLGLTITDQHALLTDMGGVVRDAVAAAIGYEEYETAVVWAEQGRSIVWQNLLGLRSPVDDLREGYPELANRLRRIAAQLEGPVPHEPDGDKGQKAPVEDVSHEYLKLALEWDNLVEEIRSLPTFEGFLKAKTFRQLAPAAHEGPVVILNVNNVRCDALILIADESAGRNVSAVSIPLERFSYEKSERMFESLTELLFAAGVRERNDRKTGRAQSRLNNDAKFKVILRILWQDVVKPVIDGLAFRPESNRPPRIWWCTTGVLAFLPIHAAGVYDTQEVGEKVSDYVVSSYTPTLTVILELSDPVVRKDFQVLTVAQASASGAPPIPKTEDEVKIVQNLVASARVLNLEKDNGTVERVREGMMESNWIHLACHGKQDSDNPMESGFLLHDGMFKLSEIVRMSLPKADFAFLSACQTAMGDERVAEESVHLAAGMLLSGCRAVIATTWSIRDGDAPKIAQEVYSRMFKDGRPDRKEAAYALHEAVKLLRESGAPCTSWVPFIHIGR